jgi:molybdopterin/thiamine biosynthesis adenylyltransferase
MTVNNDNQTEADRFFLAINDRPLLFFDKEDLDRIRSQTISMAGFGGVGSIVVELLARWGITRFRLLDMDKYDITNINRQIFATPENLGCFKAEVAAKRIKQINPYCDIEMVICDKLTKDTADTLIRGADIVLMETDTPSSSLVLHRTAKRYQVPLINGHCYQVVKGKIHIFDYRNPKQRDFDEPTRFKAINSLAQGLLDMTRKPFDKMTGKEIEQLDNNFPSFPALNFTTNLVGCLVVAETIKLITGKGSPCLHPKEIDLDLFKRKMRVSSAFSIQYTLDFIIRHGDQIMNHLKSLLTKKKVLGF